MSFVCPNGHSFPAALSIKCADCVALVVVEPVAHGMELLRRLEVAEAERTLAIEALDRIEVGLTEDGSPLPRAAMRLIAREALGGL